MEEEKKFYTANGDPVSVGNVHKVIEGGFIKYYNEDGTCTMIKSMYTKAEREELDRLKGPLYGKDAPLESYACYILDPSEDIIKAIDPIKNRDE